MRYRAKVDAAQSDVVDALRKAGWQVEDVHTGPLCDLVIWRHGEPESVRLVEVKTPKIGRPTKSQKKLAARGCPIVKLTTIQEAVNLK